MSDPIWHGEAQIAAWGESNSSGQWVRLRLHPDDAGPSNPFKGYEGQPVRVVVAPPEIEDVAPEPAEKPKPRRTLGQRCAMWCKNPEFQHYYGLPDEQAVAQYVYRRCGITSRSELDTNAKAASIWDEMLLECQLATGMMAEER